MTEKTNPKKRLSEDLLVELFQYLEFNKRVEVEQVSDCFSGILDTYGWSDVTMLNWKAVGITEITNNQIAAIGLKRMAQVVDRCGFYLIVVDFSDQKGIYQPKVSSEQLCGLFDKNKLPNLRAVSLWPGLTDDRLFLKLGNDFPDLERLSVCSLETQIDKGLSEFLVRCRSLKVLLILYDKHDATFWPLLVYLPSTLRVLCMTGRDSISKEALLAIPQSCPDLLCLVLDTLKLTDQVTKGVLRDLLQAFVAVKKKKHGDAVPKGDGDPEILRIKGPVFKSFRLKNPWVKLEF